MSFPIYRYVLAILTLACLTSCFSNPGTESPSGELNFPVAMVQSSQAVPAEHLFVLNSNFDLRYNSGTLSSIDLGCLDQRVAACAGAEDCVIRAEDAGCALFTSEVEVGSHGAGLALSANGERLYAPIRSQREVTALDVLADGSLSCGQTNGSRRCAPSASELSIRGDLTLPSDPVGITVGPLTDISSNEGTYLLMAHRAGHASLIIDQEGSEGLELVDTLDGFSSSLIGVTRRPGTQQAWFSRTRGSGIALAGLTELAGLAGMAGLTGMASAEEPERVLFDAGTLTVSGVDSSRTIGADIREIRFDPRDGAETVYALSRRPEALLIADIPSAGSSRLEIRELVDVGIGPSRLALASLRGRLFAFVSCFDSRDLYVIDLDDGRLSGVVRGMSGPFTLSVDESRERLYVADFGASVIRVVGLSTLLSCLDGAGAVGDSCAPLIEATIGEPRPVRELQ